MGPILLQRQFPSITRGEHCLGEITKNCLLAGGEGGPLSRQGRGAGSACPPGPGGEGGGEGREDLATGERRRIASVDVAPLAAIGVPWTKNVVLILNEGERFWLQLL